MQQKSLKLQSKFNDLKTGHLYNTVIPIDII